MEKRRRKRTQREVAALVGCTPQHISRYTLGDTGISVKTAMHWSKVLNVDFEALMTAPVKDRSKLLGLK